jgi:hypothetical protein
LKGEDVGKISIPNDGSAIPKINPVCEAVAAAVLADPLRHQMTLPHSCIRNVARGRWVC